MTVSDRNSIYSSSDITADTSVEIDSSSTIATDGVTTLTDQQQQQTRNVCIYVMLHKLCNILFILHDVIKPQVFIVPVDVCFCFQIRKEVLFLGHCLKQRHNIPLKVGATRKCFFILSMRTRHGTCPFFLPSRFVLHSCERINIEENKVQLNSSIHFQHYLTMIGGTIAVPFILTPAMCVEETDPARSDIVSTVIFISGVVTLLQCSIGVRLPIVQGTTFSFLVPTFAILSLHEWKCPSAEAMANMTYEDKTELWQLRMREIQGAIIVASLFQIAMGMFGIILQ